MFEIQTLYSRLGRGSLVSFPIAFGVSISAPSAPRFFAPYKFLDTPLHALGRTPTDNFLATGLFGVIGSRI